MVRTISCWCGDGSTCFGLFVDFPGKVYYDIGYSRHDLLSFHTETPDYDLYLLSGGNENAICREFRTLIGRSYIPPRWAFGLAQSRWGYKTEEDVREVARQYKEHDLPLDMICMDIEYMQDYADFTVNKERFPDLTKLSADLKAQGIRLVPIIDAGVRVDPNDSTCTEGLEKGILAAKRPTELPLWRQSGPARPTLPTSCALRCGSGSATNTRP